MHSQTYVLGPLDLLPIPIICHQAGEREMGTDGGPVQTESRAFATTLVLLFVKLNTSKHSL